MKLDLSSLTISRLELSFQRFVFKKVVLVFYITIFTYIFKYTCHMDIISFVGSWITFYWIWLLQSWACRTKKIWISLPNTLYINVYRLLYSQDLVRKWRHDLRLLPQDQIGWVDILFCEMCLCAFIFYSLFSEWFYLFLYNLFLYNFEIYCCF